MSAAVKRVQEALEGLGKRGRGGSWQCPAHEDRRASLSLSAGDGRALVVCHAGCATHDVVAAMGLTLADLFDEPRAGAGVEAVYDYVNAEGRLLFQVVRKADKVFPVRYIDPTHTEADDDGFVWHWPPPDRPRPLYRLREVLQGVAASRTVWFVEGEKDADALSGVGEVATSIAGGANRSKKWRPEWSEPLRGAQVVVVRDKDAEGTAHAERVKAALQGIAASVRVVEAAEGKDAHDHLVAGHDVDSFVNVETANGIDHLPASPFVDWSEFWQRDRTEPEWLLEDVLARGRGHSIYAAHKVGKSLLMLWCALQLVRQGVVVVYLDFEMGEDDLHERLSDMGCGACTPLELLRYALLPSLPPLDSPEGGNALLALVDAERAAHPDRHVAVVIDTFSRAVAGEENSNDTPQAFYRHTGIRLKQRGVTWARLDHAGWDGSKGARGASGKGDDVDVVWRLAPADEGLVLHRVAARMGWVPEKVALGKTTDPVLGFRPVASVWPLGTEATAGLLDDLGVPVGASVVTAQAALQDAGQGRRKMVVAAAQKWRRLVSEAPGTAREPLHLAGAGTAAGTENEKPSSLGGNRPGTAGNRDGGDAGNRCGSPLGTARVPTPDPDDLERWNRLARGEE